MGYYIDLEKITINDYKTKLKSSYLPPGRMVLQEKSDERFGYFMQIGIKNIKELIQLLKKKDTFAELSKVDCLSGDYLVILLRELNCTFPKPNRIAGNHGYDISTTGKFDGTNRFSMIIEVSSEQYGKITTNAVDGVRIQ
jgi:hypothetical protein